MRTENAHGGMGAKVWGAHQRPERAIHHQGWGQSIDIFLGKPAALLDLHTMHDSVVDVDGRRIDKGRSRDELHRKLAAQNARVISNLVAINRRIQRRPQQGCIEGRTVLRVGRHADCCRTPPVAFVRLLHRLLNDGAEADDRGDRGDGNRDPDKTEQNPRAVDPHLRPGFGE